MKSPCCKKRLEHLHGVTYRCPGCNAGFTLNQTSKATTCEQPAPTKTDGEPKQLALLSPPA